MKSFAIVLVCYKRLSGIQRLLKSLEVVDYSGRNDITLIFSIDIAEILRLLIMRIRIYGRTAIKLSGHFQSVRD